jgi:hypothetical protein
MKEWEKYESQIFDKLRKDFPEAEILKNQKIRGVFSKRSRQIDILIKGVLIGKKIIGVIDCKKFSKKIDVKAVESFIAFVEDVRANIGIMITNVGYTKSAKNRITEYIRDIRLDVVKFERFEEYNFTWDMCSYCDDDESFSKGEILWDIQETLIKDGIIKNIEKGQCSKCGNEYLKCEDCGEIFLIDFEDMECGCGNIYSVEYEYIGQGMTENRIILKSYAIQDES